MTGWQSSAEKFRQRFLARSGEVLGRVRQLLAFAEADGLSEDARLELTGHFHFFAGAGGTYGYERVSEIGLAGEALCEKMGAAAACRQETVAASLAELADRIESELAGPAG